MKQRDRQKVMAEKKKNMASISYEGFLYLKKANLKDISNK